MRGRRVLLTLVVFLAGVGVGNADRLSRLAQQRLMPAAPPPLKEYDYLENAIAPLVTIGSARDVAARRKALVDYVWKDAGFPVGSDRLRIEPGDLAPGYSRLVNASGVDEMTLPLPHGLIAVSHQLHPKRPNGKLLIFHRGHEPSWSGTAAIDHFLGEGYTVAAFSMPLYGYNNRPIVELPRWGRMRLIGHHMLRLLDSDRFSALRLYLEPVHTYLNRVEGTFRDVAMVGLSGGGWATTVCAAIDPRIRKSYPVAGSYPFYLQQATGDYEQTEMGFYRIANFLELYVLGAHGEGRKQLQVLNRYDSCCYYGDGHRTYADEIASIAAGLGPGGFEVYADTSHRTHAISEAALEVITRDLRLSD